MKRISIVIMTIILIILGSTIVSATEVTSGQCGENLRWVLDDTGTIIVSGTGKMTDYGYGKAPWYASCDSVKKVVVEEGITSIGSYAFYGCDYLSSVTLPNTLATINERAFYSCNITYIEFPDSLETIDEYAFGWNKSMRVCILPNSVTTIGEAAFDYCQLLSVIKIGNNVTTVGKNPFSRTAFYEKESNWENDVLFVGNILLEVRDGVNGIYDVPKGTQIIADSAFRDVSELQYISLPKTVIYVGEYNLSNITGVFFCGTEAEWESINVVKTRFDDFDNIAILYDDNKDEKASGKCGSNLKWNFEDGVLNITGSGNMQSYSSVRKVQWDYYRDKIETVIFGSFTTSISDWTFSNCSNLKEVIFYGETTTIGNHAFSDCVNLRAIELPKVVTAIGEYAFAECENLNSMEITANSIGMSAFENCTALKYASISQATTTIGKSAFKGCSNLTSFKFPVTFYKQIPESVFEGCTSLSNVTISHWNVSIGDKAFANCYNLTDLYYGGIEEQWNALTIGSDNDVLSDVNIHYLGQVFGYCGTGVSDYDSPSKNLQYIIDTTSDRMYIIGSGTMYTCTYGAYPPYASYRSKINYVSLPIGLLTIGGSAFRGFSKLTNIIIPDGVVYIEGNAFSSSGLTEVYIPKSVTSIGDWAFRYCNNLTDVYFGGTEAEWNNIDIGTYNSCLTNANIHYNCTMPLPEEPEKPIEPEFSFNTTNDKVYGFIGIDCLNSGTIINGNFTVDGRLYVILKSNEYTLSDINWNVSDESIFKITSIYDGPIENSQTIDIKTLKKGTTTLTASLPDGTSISVDVEIINANNIELTEKYAPEYLYSNGSFLSNSKDLSTTPEIYIAIKNSPKILYDFEENEDINNLHNVKINASISGNNLSFDKYSYKNSYEAIINELRLEESVADLLLFYPYNVDENTFATEKKFDVTLTISADELDTPYTETISFTVENYNEYATSLNIEKHSQFINNNSAYQMLKNNDAYVYAERIKNSWDYRWNNVVFNMISVENILFNDINDLVVADIISEYIASPMYEHFGTDLLIKTFAGNYEQILLTSEEILNDAGYVWSSLPGHIDKMVLNDYVDEEMNLKPHTIDKLLKISKYNSADAKFKDQDFFTHVSNCFKNAPNAQVKINAVFSTLDKAGVAWDIAGMVGDISNNIIDGINYTTVLNSYYYADEAKKNTISLLLAAMHNVNLQVPGYFSNECLDAVQQYVLTESKVELIANNIKTWMNQGEKMAFEVYNGIFKDYVHAGIWSVVGAIKVTVSGGSKVAFASSTGASVGSGLLFGWMGGKCVSNILCNSEDKASEMAKAVILGKISLAAKGVLMLNEAEVINSPTEQNIEKFEQSLELFKIIQSQSIKHLIEVNKAKAFSLIEIIFTDREHQVVEVNNALENDRKFYESIVCHGDNVDAVKSLSPVTESVKVIQIKCPVNVCLYSLDDELLVQIIDNQVVFAAEGVVASIYDNAKYVIIPADQQFKIEIVANESGTMNYSVTEYNQGETVRKVNFNDISLYEGQSFSGNLNAGYEIFEESYALNTTDADNNQEVIYHSEVYSGSQIQKLNVNVTCQGDGEARGVSSAICGDYVIVVATPNDGIGFSGWYDSEGKLLSREVNYGFVIREDMELVAKFQSGVLGDLNGDDEVTDSDAIYLMYHTFFPEEYPANQDCDFDGDGEVTDNDAIYLMYHTFFPEEYPLSN